MLYMFARVLVHEDVAVAGDGLLAEEARPEVVETRHGTVAAVAGLHPEEPRRHLHVALLLHRRLRHWLHRRRAPPSWRTWPWILMVT